jgi:hypothetical protein
MADRAGCGCIRLLSLKEVEAMDVVFWFLAMFLLGLISMGLAYLFLRGCEII